MKFLKYTILFLLAVSFINCVQERHLKTVTFKVDMSNVDSVNQVGIRGNFTESSWNETLLMTDDNNDNIYELTLEQTTAVSGIQFKFVNQYDQFELQDLDNRIINFEYKPENIVYEAVFNDPNGKQSSK